MATHYAVITSKNILDYFDPFKLQVLVGANNSGRSTLSRVLALLMAEALWDQGVMQEATGRVGHYSPMLIDDEFKPAGLTRQMRSVLLTGLTQSGRVKAQQFFHSFGVVDQPQPQPGEDYYFVYGVSAVWAESVTRAMEYFNLYKTPMFLADHRTKPEVAAPTDIQCGRTSKGLVISFIDRHGRQVAAGFSFGIDGDYTTITAMPEAIFAADC